MAPSDLRILSLDDGGVHGTSTILTLARLLEKLSPHGFVADHFDMVIGSGSGAFIAVLLGQLRMSLKECFDAYVDLQEAVAVYNSKQNDSSNQPKDRVKQFLDRHGLSGTTMFDSSETTGLRICVCRRGDLGNPPTRFLRNYPSTHSTENTSLQISTVLEGIFASLRASSPVDPGTESPVFELDAQARDIWGPRWHERLQCLVSIGVGGTDASRSRRKSFFKPLMLSLTKREVKLGNSVARTFSREYPHLAGAERYHRLEIDERATVRKNSGLGEALQAEVGGRLDSSAVERKIQQCADKLAQPRCFGHYDIEPLPGGVVRVAAGFHDRQDTRDALDWQLKPWLNPHSQQEGRRVAVLHGGAGLGKTQLAAQFVQRWRCRFSSVFWLDGRTEDRLRESIAREALRIPGGQVLESTKWRPIDKGPDHMEMILADVMQWLARPDNQNWLIVFDNLNQYLALGSANVPFDVAKYIPANHGSVLITTRLRDLQELDGKIQLGSPGDDLTPSIFTDMASVRLGTGTSVNELVGAFKATPLALTIASSYVRETNIDIESYMRLLKEQSGAMDEKGWPPGYTPDCSTAYIIAVVWMVSLREIRKRSSAAASFLRFWAWFDEKDMWHGILVEITRWQPESADEASFWPDWLKEIAGSETHFQQVTDLLLRFSMIEKHEFRQASFSMESSTHRLTGLLQDDAEKDSSCQLAVATIGILVDDGEGIDQYRTIDRRLLPHADRATWWLGFLRRGQPWAFDETTLDHPALLSALHGLGNVCRWLGKQTLAEVMLQRASEGRDRVSGTDHPSTLRVMHDLGLAHRAIGAARNDETSQSKAETTLRRVLQGRTRTLGADDVLSLRAAHDLGVVYRDQAKLEDAACLFRRAMEGYEAKLGRNHILTLDACNDLGLVSINMNRLEEAKRMFQRQFEHCKDLYGSDDAFTLNSANNLSLAYIGLAETDKAEQLLEMISEKFEKTRGPNHASTLGALKNLGVVYLNSDRVAKAETLSRCVLGRYQGMMREDGAKKSSAYASAAMNLGVACLRQEKLGEAEELFRDALRVYEEELDHVTVIHASSNLGRALCREGKLEEAEVKLQQAIEGSKKVFPAGDERTLGLERELQFVRSEAAPGRGEAGHGGHPNQSQD